jgi:hypothetical protein
MYVYALETVCKNRNIGDLYRGVNEFKKVTNLEVTC